MKLLAFNQFTIPRTLRMSWCYYLTLNIVLPAALVHALGVSQSGSGSTQLTECSNEEKHVARLIELVRGTKGDGKITGKLDISAVSGDAFVTNRTLPPSHFPDVITNGSVGRRFRRG